MSHGIAVKALDRAGGPHRAGGQDFFAVDGAPVVLLGDRIVPHGPVPHANPVMVEGSSWMTLNGIPACRAGQKLALTPTL
ncbi:hypothetical protein [Undibacterium sp. TC9W]|uniref:hypothetical protein n=1 Tax=Undibacterium sp. TC9W TaxID=3413053 RepID=UPI003BF18B75